MPSVPRAVVLGNGRGLVDVLAGITGGGEGVSYAVLGVNVDGSVAGGVEKAVLLAWRRRGWWWCLWCECPFCGCWWWGMI